VHICCTSHPHARHAGEKLFALNTAVLVPVPDYTAKCHIMVTSGKAKYDATKKAIVSGGCECCGVVWARRQPQWPWVC
jgi:hypothetical protein